jgi:pimeloyl-ACP methyl ester carboxylesterase
VRLLTFVLERLYPGTRHGADGAAPAFFATVCRDQYTARQPLPAAPATPAYRGFSIVGFMADVCRRAGYGRQPAPPPLAAPATTIPALLLSGRFDPMTPDLYAAELAETFAAAVRVTIPDAGHSTLSQFDSCQTQLATAFLRAPATTRTLPCVGELRPPRFVRTPEEAASSLAAR